MTFTAIQSNDLGSIMEEAGHNFEVTLEPCFLKNGYEVPDRKVCVQSNTGTYLGTVGKGYMPVQPTKFYELAQGLVEQSGGRIDQALTLRGGSVMGLSINMGDTEYVRGDRISRNMILMTSFDCSYAVLGRANSNRWVCLNQLPSSKHVFNLKHTANVQVRLDTRIKMLGYMQTEIETFDNKMQTFANHRMSENEMIEWFGNLLPKPALDSQRSLSRQENIRAEFLDLLYTGKGTDLPGVKGTAYHAVNALTEYCNHHRSTRVMEGRSEAEVRFESVTFGSADKLMQAGVESMLQLIGGG